MSDRVWTTELPAHLDLAHPPLAVCNRCWRQTWFSAAVGSEDRMTQPDGNPCGGRFEPHKPDTRFIQAGA